MTMQKTNADAIAWVHSLKPGDKVIYMEPDYPGYRPADVKEVYHVTPTGFVRMTDGCSFRQESKKETFCVSGMVRYTRGKIVPYTEELEREILSRKKVKHYD